VLDQIAAKYSNVGELLAAEVPLDPAQLHRLSWAPWGF